MTPELEEFSRSCGPNAWARVLILSTTLDVRKVSEFARFTEADILRRRNVGKVTFAKLKRRLLECGVQLRKTKVGWGYEDETETNFDSYGIEGA